MDITANENSMLSDKKYTPDFHVQIIVRLTPAVGNSVILLLV